VIVPELMVFTDRLQRSYRWCVMVPECMVPTD